MIDSNDLPEFSIFIHADVSVTLRKDDGAQVEIKGWCALQSQCYGMSQDGSPTEICLLFSDSC
jgi:hypothetical protein